MTRQQLAVQIGVRWPTVDRWTKDDGFNEKNQKLVAQALGLQHDYFRIPDTAIVHRLHCEQILRDFLSSPLASLDISDAEKAALSSLRVPLDRTPTQQFYLAMLMLLRGQLQTKDFERELKENEELHREKNAELTRIRQASQAADVGRRARKTRPVQKRKK